MASSQLALLKWDNSGNGIIKHTKSFFLQLRTMAAPGLLAFFCPLSSSSSDNFSKTSSRVCDTIETIMIMNNTVFS